MRRRKKAYYFHPFVPNWDGIIIPISKIPIDDIFFPHMENVDDDNLDVEDLYIKKKKEKVEKQKDGSEDSAYESGSYYPMDLFRDKQPYYEDDSSELDFKTESGPAVNNDYTFLDSMNNG